MRAMPRDRQRLHRDGERCREIRFPAPWFWVRQTVGQWEEPFLGHLSGLFNGFSSTGSDQFSPRDNHVCIRKGAGPKNLETSFKGRFRILMETQTPAVEGPMLGEAG